MACLYLFWSFFFCSSVINFFSSRVKFTLGFLVFILIIVEYISFLKNYILRLILLAFKKAIDFYRLKTGHLTEIRYGTSFCHNCLTCLDSVFSSVAHSCPTLCDPMNHSTPGLPVHHQLPEFTQTHVHWVGDAIQPSHPLLSPSLSTFNPSQHQGLFKWVSSSHQVAKVLEFQLQHQSFQWTLRTDLL